MDVFNFRITIEFSLKLKDWLYMKLVKETDKSKFIRYFLGTLYSPNNTFNQLMSDENRLKYGMIAIFVVGIIYGISCFIGWLNGYFPEYPVPTLAGIGPMSAQEDYYGLQAFLTPFYTLLIFIIFGSFSQLIARSLGGKGTYEDTIALSAFITVTQIPFFWIPETFMMVFNFFSILIANPIINELRHFITFSWMFFLGFLAIRSIHQLDNRKTFLITICGFIPMFFVAITYIR
jgi:hypothetical protein